MLTRPHAHLAPSPARVRISRSRQDARRVGPGPVSPRLRQWLSAPGSLTARLRLHGSVRVEVLDQGRRRLWPQERRALGCCVGHVREVVLRIDDQPAVWARSSVPVRAVKGPWQAIRGLGTRPLAELLFSHRAVRRGPLQALRLRTHGPAGAHMARQWARLNMGQALASPPLPNPRWARHSLFRHHGQPLQVLEAFAPWVSARSCRHG
jgi:chorismate lyase